MIQRLLLGYSRTKSVIELLNARRHNVVINSNCVFKVVPVDFDPSTFDSYYNGCCNETFWPLFHSMPDKAKFSVESWKVIIDKETTL